MCVCAMFIYRSYACCHNWFIHWFRLWCRYTSKKLKKKKLRGRQRFYMHHEKSPWKQKDKYSAFPFANATMCSCVCCFCLLLSCSNRIYIYIYLRSKLMNRLNNFEFNRSIKNRTGSNGPDYSLNVSRIDDISIWSVCVGWIIIRNCDWLLIQSLHPISPIIHGSDREKERERERGDETRRLNNERDTEIAS